MLYENSNALIFTPPAHEPIMSKTKSSEAYPIIQGMKDFTEDKQYKKHCKIVATIGPASQDPQILEELICAGLDVARLNFSHGTEKNHAQTIEKIRQISKKLGKNVSILQDLQGPKIRCGQLKNEQINIEKNKIYKLTFGNKQESNDVIPVDYNDLSKDINLDEIIMMDDGLLSFKVIKIEGEQIEIIALNSGVLKSRKGVNFPNTQLTLPPLTEKDKKDLLFGVSQNVDAIALSFVRQASDIKSCRKLLTTLGSDIPIIAKIEKTSAVEFIDDIAEESQGLMVARGDLGIEGKIEKVPGFQRKIIAAAQKNTIPVIIATQMLESMIEAPKPTLAEINDVANGVLEGADCVMLSGEVAAGKYPVECVKKMSSIIETVESWSLKTEKKQISFHKPHSSNNNAWQIHEAIAKSACDAANSFNAKIIVCLTLTGSIARLISSWRPACPIVAISPRNDIVKRLLFSWGVYGFRNPLFYETDILLQDLPLLLKSSNIVRSKDKIVITAGVPMNSSVSTNMIKITEIP